jgi:CBS domain-containing protein
MQDKSLRRLAVTDNQGKVIGVLTAGDIVRAMIAELDES